MTAKRVTFVKVAEEHDYVDARFDVLLDGEKVGQVTRNVEGVETSRSALSSSRLADYRPTTVWSAEDVGYYAQRRTRIEAASDLLMKVKGWTYWEARKAITGKEF